MKRETGVLYSHLLPLHVRIHGRVLLRLGYSALNGTGTPGFSLVGVFIAVMCLEFNEVNFCKDASVTTSLHVTCVYWLHLYQYNNLLLHGLLP